MCEWVNTQTHTYVHTHRHTQAHTQAHRHTQAHAGTHRHTQAHTQTHTQKFFGGRGTRQEGDSITHARHIATGLFCLVRRHRRLTNGIENTDRHRQTQTDTERHRQTPARHQIAWRNRWASSKNDSHRQGQYTCTCGGGREQALQCMNVASSGFGPPHSHQTFFLPTLHTWPVCRCCCFLSKQFTAPCRANNRHSTSPHMTSGFTFQVCSSNSTPALFCCALLPCPS